MLKSSSERSENLVGPSSVVCHPPSFSPTLGCVLEGGGGSFGLRGAEDLDGSKNCFNVFNPVSLAVLRFVAHHDWTGYVLCLERNWESRSRDLVASLEFCHIYTLVSGCTPESCSSQFVCKAFLLHTFAVIKFVLVSVLVDSSNGSFWATTRIILLGNGTLIHIASQLASDEALILSHADFVERHLASPPFPPATWIYLHQWCF